MMAYSIRSVKCPDCGASLPIEEGRTQVFCSYCGAKIIVSNDNEHIYRHVDEASIKQAETDRIIRMRELDLEEKNAKSRKTLIIVWLIAVAVVLLTSIILMILPNSSLHSTGLLLIYVALIIGMLGGMFIFRILPEKENERAMLKNGGIRFPEGLTPFSEKNYEVVLVSLQNAGFSNVTCINLHDLTIGVLQKPGKIESISIDGEKITSGGKVYLANAPIVITYHGK